MQRRWKHVSAAFRGLRVWSKHARISVQAPFGVMVWGTFSADCGLNPWHARVLLLTVSISL